MYDRIFSICLIKPSCCSRIKIQLFFVRRGRNSVDENMNGIVEYSELDFYKSSSESAKRDH